MYTQLSEKDDLIIVPNTRSDTPSSLLQFYEYLQQHIYVFNKYGAQIVDLAANHDCSIYTHGLNIFVGCVCDSRSLHYIKHIDF